MRFLVDESVDVRIIRFERMTPALTRFLELTGDKEFSGKVFIIKESGYQELARLKAG